MVRSHQEWKDESSLEWSRVATTDAIPEVLVNLIEERYMLGQDRYAKMHVEGAFLPDEEASTYRPQESSKRLSVWLDSYYELSKYVKGNYG